MTATTESEHAAPWSAFAVGAIVAAFGVGAAWMLRTTVGFCADGDNAEASQCGQYTSSLYALIGTIVLVIAVAGLFGATFYARPPRHAVLIVVALVLVLLVSIATPAANLFLPIPDVPEDFYP